MRAHLCAVLLGGFAYAADSPLREVQSECPVISKQPVSEFRRGYLFRFSYAFDPIMRVFGRDGRFAFNAPVRFPSGDLAMVQDVDVDSDGSIVVAAVGYRKASYGLAMLDSNGAQTAFISTPRFAPGRLAIAGDHSIWVLGAKNGKKSADYMVLRKYNHDGKLLGSYLPRSTFPPGLEPGSASVGVAVRAAGDRVAVVAYSGATGNLREVIELDGSGKVLGRMRLDRGDFMDFALTSDGNLYSWDQTLMPYGGLVLLNPVTASSTRLEIPGHYYELLGADGENLVYRGPGDGTGINEVWFHQPGR